MDDLKQMRIAVGGAINSLFSIGPLIDIITHYAVCLPRILCGGQRAGHFDGNAAHAWFNHPMAVTAYRDPKTHAASWLVADSGGYVIRQFSPDDGIVSTFAGTPSARGNLDGTLSQSKFMGVFGIYVDPTDKASRVWVADYTCLRIIDPATEMISSLAGSGIGYADGVGRSAHFFGISGIRLTADGKSILCTDQWNNRLRAIDVLSGSVSTLAGNAVTDNKDGMGILASFRYPTSCCWGNDRALYRSNAAAAAGDAATAVSGPPSRTELYIASYQSIRRYDMTHRTSTRTHTPLTPVCPNKPSGAEEAVTTVPLRTDLHPIGIECVTASGMLIVTCRSYRAVYSVHPLSGKVERVAGTLKVGFNPPTADEVGDTTFNATPNVLIDALTGVAINDSDHSAIIVDSKYSCLRVVTLSAVLFEFCHP